MRSLQETSKNISEYQTQMEAYVGWVLHVQSLADPNGIDIRTEPKFNLPDGSVFTSGMFGVMIAKATISSKCDFRRMVPPPERRTWPPSDHSDDLCQHSHC